MSCPLFRLGRIVATPGALKVLCSAKTSAIELLSRHQVGDWGELDGDDQEANRIAVEEGLRVLSSYRLDSERRLWIITEADRSATTLLLPSEY